MLFIYWIDLCFKFDYSGVPLFPNLTIFHFHLNPLFLGSFCFLIFAIFTLNFFLSTFKIFITHMSPLNDWKSRESCVTTQMLFPQAHNYDSCYLATFQHSLCVAKIYQFSSLAIQGFMYIIIRRPFILFVVKVFRLHRFNHSIKLRLLLSLL